MMKYFSTIVVICLVYYIYMVNYSDICNVIKCDYMMQRSGWKDATRKRNVPFSAPQQAALATFDRLKQKRMKGVWLAEIISKRYGDNFK